MEGKYSMYSINQIAINSFLREKARLKNKVKISEPS